MYQSWVIEVAAGAFVAVSVFETLARARRPRARPRLDSPGIALEYGTGFRVAWVGCVAVTLAMASLFAFVLEPETPKDRILTVLLVIVALALPSLWYVIEGFTRRITVTDQGIKTSSAVGVSRTLAWADVLDLRYSALNRWLVIRSRSGRPVRVSRYLDGIVDLCDALRSHLPPETLTRVRHTIALFEQMAPRTGAA
jgi:hypothetical protein